MFGRSVGRSFVRLAGAGVRARVQVVSCCRYTSTSPSPPCRARCSAWTRSICPVRPERPLLLQQQQQRHRRPLVGVVVAEPAAAGREARRGHRGQHHQDARGAERRRPRRPGVLGGRAALALGRLPGAPPPRSLASRAGLARSLVTTTARARRAGGQRGAGGGAAGAPARARGVQPGGAPGGVAGGGQLPRVGALAELLRAAAGVRAHLRHQRLPHHPPPLLRRALPGHGQPPRRLRPRHLRAPGRRRGRRHLQVLPQGAPGRHQRQRIRRSICCCCCCCCCCPY
eukprot:scaffold865_cov312-Prasinococcus_capsulatus_cf.AAC.6